ncbi:MAG: hypothetical protein Q9227_000431 [Pyrenula ochraceoflavens]
MDFQQPPYDVLIIGAGPCGLAVAARLREQTPSALFTDDEHKRYHWTRRHNRRMAVKNCKNGKTQSANSSGHHRYSMLLLDAAGDEWLIKWKKQFEMLEIDHLRSPMFFHLDPRDRDALLAFMFEKHRQSEVYEISGCVGKETSKHGRKKNRRHIGTKEPMVDERDRKDYYAPSSKLFMDQCNCLADHYCLQHGMIKHECVEDVDYADHEDDFGSRLFTIRTNKQVHRARVVVLAIGVGNAPKIPDVPRSARIECSCHTGQMRKFLDRELEAKLCRGATTNVLVVGGGLTSAQVTDLAIRKGVTKVWHVMRSHMKVKPFDVDLKWIGKFRNVEQAVFWSEDSDEERLQQILTARNGGSITPTFHKRLECHVRKEKLRILTNTTIKSKRWDAGNRTWTVHTEPYVDLPAIDYIYYATGVLTDVHALPFLQTLQKKHPVASYGGLPRINNDLMWNNEVPLFVTGRLGSLRIGPGAANLAGARIGAEIIAWSVADILEKDGAVTEEVDNYALGIGSRYNILDADIASDG